MKSKIGNFFKKSKLLSDLWALLLLALGVFLLMYPDTAVKVVCQLIGIGMLLYGLVLVSSFLIVGTRTSYGNPNIFRVIFGVLLMVMGLFVSVRPGTIEEFAGILFAVLLFAWSINQFLEMKNLIELKDKRWWLALFGGLITVIFACVVMFAPIESNELLMRIAGIGLVYTAVCGLLFNFRVVRYAFKYERTYGPLIEDVTGQNVSIGPPKEPPTVIDGEVRIVEDEKEAEETKDSAKKEKKKGFFRRRKKKEAEETTAAGSDHEETPGENPASDGASAPAEEHTPDKDGEMSAEEMSQEGSGTSDETQNENASDEENPKDGILD